MNRRLTIALALALAAVAVPALAVPARTGTVSASAPAFAWDGGPGNGVGQGVGAVRCTPAIYECEDTLIDLKDAGDLEAAIKAGSGANDLDVAIYASDADGTTDSQPGADNPLAEDISTGKDAKTTAKKLKPGYYVVRVRFFDATAASYKGTATLKNFAGPAPPATTPAATPTPTATPAPKPAKKKQTKRAKCMKKAKKIKNKKKRAKAVKKCKKIKN